MTGAQDNEPDQLLVAHRRIDELEARLAAQSAASPATPVASPAPVATTRRRLLGLAGAAVAGGAAASLVASGTASAVTGTMLYGAANNATTSTTSLTASLNGVTFTGANTNVNTDAIGVLGQGVGDGTGVKAVMTSPTEFAIGVWSEVQGTGGLAVAANGGRAQLGLFGDVVNPLTTLPAVMHYEGEIAYTLSNELIACVATGTPGTWRRLASTTTAGAFSAISPARVYDSRKALPGPQSPLATGATRTVFVGDQRNTTTGGLVTAGVVPIGATAVAYNLTIVNTVGPNGFLAVNPGGNSVVGASAINWFAAGQTVANASVVKLDGSRQITVICGGAATSCDFIIDVVGFYR